MSSPSALQIYFSNPPAHFTGEIKFNEPLARYTYYQIGGPAQVFAVPRSRGDLEWVWRGVRETGSMFFFLGAGSNILVSDSGFSGVVIRLNKLNTEVAESGLRLTAGGSVMISVLLRRAAAEGWGGLEFLGGVPGSVGGAVKMNAGTHLGETQGSLREVRAILLTDGGSEEKIYSGDELRFQYRRNLFLPENAVVWSTQWEVIRGDPAQIRAVIDATLARRKQSQPVDYPSCGSVFKNPKETGLSAWQILDRLGLRGHREGNAQISEKHSNFIINLGGATAADVRALIALAKVRAKTELGIELVEEVIYVG